LGERQAGLAHDGCYRSLRKGLWQAAFSGKIEPQLGLVMVGVCFCAVHFGRHIRAQ
jgi:hypothetical protein